MTMQVLRLSDAVHKDVSQFAVKSGKKMNEVSDEIVLAGLAALSGNGAASSEPANEDAAPAPAGDGARDTLLVGALDAEAMDLVRKYRDELASRPKRAEKLTLADTACRLVVTAWNRLLASQKYAQKAR